MKIAINNGHPRLCLYSCLFLLPGIISLIFNGVMHITCNFIVVYLLVDGMILLVSRGYSVYRLKREKEEYSLETAGNGFHYLKRKVGELRDIEK